MSPRVRRFIALLVAPWFAAVTAAPTEFHQCAMHSVGAAHTGHGAAQGTGGRSAGHDHAVSHESAPGHTVPPCTCDSGCCVSAAPVTAPGAVLLVVPEAVRQASPELVNTGVASAESQLALPFANGPPARV